MPRVKYMPNSHTIYLANQIESWDGLRNAPKYISEEMFNDILFVNSGAALLHEKIGPLISHTNGCGYHTIVFLYPTADTGSISDHLYNRLREAASKGINFKESFRFSVVKVSAREVEWPENEDLVGLRIRFI